VVGCIRTHSLPQRPPFCRTFDVLGSTHGRTEAVAANLVCTGTPRWHNPLVSARWYMLVCSLVPSHTVLTTAFFHQQSAFAVSFLHFAALGSASFFSRRAHVQLPLQMLMRDTQAQDTLRVYSNFLLSYRIYTQLCMMI